MNADIAREAFAADPGLEALVQEFAERMAQQAAAAPPAQGSQLRLPADAASTGDSEFVQVDPLPGFVFKTRTTKASGDYPHGMKVFCNVCHSPDAAAPPILPEKELRLIIEASDASQYRIPMGLSPPRSDIDKGGQVCLVFDVCVNSQPLALALKNQSFKVFLVQMAIAWIDHKHNLSLSEDFTEPRMRSKGTIARQVLRKNRRPFISEVNPPKQTPSLAGTYVAASESPSTSAKAPGLGKSQDPTPEYIILCEPTADQPDYLVVRISLPAVSTVAGSFLDIEADRLIFNLKDKYHLDISLPTSINIDEAGAQFDRASRILSVTTSALRTDHALAAAAEQPSG
ncbi:hypothetical protein HK105_206909 [Polyrhizophydium stewartii]|uniref:PIH1 domain-containing protein 1 n=1 Tax=Polyrhizophydium stewartii TaxID=2732419 RepID=A0ABR4N296_9FUNG|nr:PIH1 domain-containing protein 1 [Polyrhizophydium stewartii]